MKGSDGHDRDLCEPPLSRAPPTQPHGQPWKCLRLSEGEAALGLQAASWRAAKEARSQRGRSKHPAAPGLQEDSPSRWAPGDLPGQPAGLFREPEAGRECPGRPGGLSARGQGPRPRSAPWPATPLTVGLPFPRAAREEGRVSWSEGWRWRGTGTRQRRGEWGAPGSGPEGLRAAGGG